MTDLDQRLARCFTIAFPRLSMGDALNASPKSVEEWDSIGAINLAALISEEFAMEVDLERLPDLQSFAAFRDLIETEFAARRAPGQGG